MRQRASTKTQRRLKQQQLMRDPYALTDDVYCEPPTFRVGGLVTAMGVLQLVAAVTLGGFVFGGALLVCAVLLAALGLALLHHSDPKAGSAQGLGLKQAIARVLALRRSALDYSLTLSIAQSQQYAQPHKKKELQIAVVPANPTPQKVVATMALTQETRAETRLNRLADNAPLATLNRVDMKALPTINSFAEESAHDLLLEKPRANSEPKQVLRTRPLLPLRPKVQQTTPANTTQDKKKKRTQQTKTEPVVQKTSVKEGAKAPQMQKKAQPKPQKPRRTPAQKVAQVAAKKEVPLPTVLPKAEPKAVLPAVLPKAKPVRPVVIESKPKPVELASPATIVVEPFVRKPAVPSAELMPVFPERKSLVELARGKPALEQELAVTRKVLLYLSPEGETMVDLEDEELEHEIEKERELELEQELEDYALSLEAFPPLSPPMVPQAPPATEVMEPNFLMDIALEPISRPEKKLISLSSLRLKPVGNADLRTMLDELDVMRLELDAAMARCTSLLNGEENKALCELPASLTSMRLQHVCASYLFCFL
ncbi:CMP-sialic acid transporter 4 [Phytophthora cinnamomi]|uniref:CMP-sialic acid transporter 4 n=1 Tax=Phytophthora cinnamomi TaxID=4785 RepID=UPI00355A3E02|nr:CMP-sialic acid transporter 4 [Phytophthora cinnamomi]